MMPTYGISQNFHLRECYLKKNQVPTQTVMKKYMTPGLADIYFKSMSPKIRLVAGLEPPLNGGGSSWYITPQDLLQGRVVLKPLQKKYLSKFSYHGFDEFGIKLVEIYRTEMISKKTQIEKNNNEAWKRQVELLCDAYEQELSMALANDNTYYIQNLLSEFTALYTSSITKFQNLTFDETLNKIKLNRKEIFQKTQTRYEHLLQQQATTLYNIYTKKLIKRKEDLKTKFIEKLEITRTECFDKLHDINLEKHVAVEKLKKLLKCTTLACQVYVSLKERLASAREIEKSKVLHINKHIFLTKAIKSKEYKIAIAAEEEKGRLETDKMWKKKVCHMVKNFQIFVKYCLKLLPEHADFFINMEKLMLLQLGEALTNPNTSSIIVTDVGIFDTPILKPRPFYLFCEEGYRAKVDQNLCPKHITSSASQLPVIVINKRCIYAACDNFEQFTDKIKDYVFGIGEEETDIEDDNDYSRDVPVQYTTSQQLLELKLESSLLQLLQQEISNIRNLTIECPGCRIPHCFDCKRRESGNLSEKQTIEMAMATVKIPTMSLQSSNIKKLNRDEELEYEREPKWDSYCRYIKSKKCLCGKMTKKHLFDNLPVYMRKTSKYQAPELPNYETCSVSTLKFLIKNTKRQDEYKPPVVIPSKTKEMTTQCEDLDFEYCCTCLSEDGSQLFNSAASDDGHFRVADSSPSSTYLSKEIKSFALDRALSLQRLIQQFPEVKEIFDNVDCTFK